MFDKKQRILIFLFATLLCFCPNISILHGEESLSAKSIFYFGAGYPFPQSDFSIDGGVFQGEEASFTHDSIDQEGILAFKLGFFSPTPRDFPYFRFGLNIDYNATSIEEVRFEGSTENFQINTSGEVGDLHVLSIFLTPRFLLPLGGEEMNFSPYVEFGIGGNFFVYSGDESFFKFSNSNTARLNEGAYLGFGLYLAGGFEWSFSTVNQGFAIFIESRWQYSLEEKILVRPSENSLFQGDFEYSSLSVLLGVSFYLN